MQDYYFLNMLVLPQVNNLLQVPKIKQHGKKKCYIWRDLKQKNNLSNKKRRLAKTILYIMMVDNFLGRHAIVYISTPADQEKESINLITHLQLQLVLKKSHRKKEREILRNLIIKFLKLFSSREQKNKAILKIKAKGSKKVRRK